MALRDKILVNKDEAIQKKYEDLSKDTLDYPLKPFRYDRDVFLAAAAIACSEGKWDPLKPGEGKDKFMWSTLLNDDLALPALQALALHHSGKPEVLLDDDRVAEIAEGYANAGIKLLFDRLTGKDVVDELKEASMLLQELLEAVKETTQPTE